MLYKCKRCDKEFNQKSNYNYHLNRKNPCKNINNIINTDTNNEIIQNLNNPSNSINNPSNSINNPANSIKNLSCIYCNRIFTRSDSLLCHTKNRCEIKKDKYILLEEENKKLKEENELLKKQLILSPKIKSKTSIHNQTNIENQSNIIHNNNITETNNITQTNNIIINFGDEDMSKLTEKEILDSLKSLSNCFQNFVKIVHLNTRIPEYNNILINNMRSNYGYIITDNKLITKDKNQIIAELITLRVDDLESLSIDYKNKLCSRELSFIKDNIEFLRTAYIETEDIDGNIVKGKKTSAKKLKDIYKQLLFMFYDNKDIIKHK